MFERSCQYIIVYAINLSRGQSSSRIYFLPIFLEYGEMNVEQELYEAIERALSEKRIRSVAALCEEAGVHQPSVNTWIKTKRAMAGAGKMPKKPKETIYFDVASKLIACLGGSLIFPETTPYTPDVAELARLKAENEKLKADNVILDKKLYACEQVCQKFENMITQRLPPANDVPVEVRQDKSCA